MSGRSASIVLFCLIAAGAIVVAPQFWSPFAIQPKRGAQNLQPTSATKTPITPQTLISQIGEGAEHLALGPAQSIAPNERPVYPEQIDISLTSTNMTIELGMPIDVVGTTTATPTRAFAQIDVALIGPDYHGDLAWPTVSHLATRHDSLPIVEITTAQLSSQASQGHSVNFWDAAFPYFSPGTPLGRYTIAVYDVQSKRLATSTVLTLIP